MISLVILALGLFITMNMQNVMSLPITCNDFHQCVNSHIPFTFHCDLPSNSNFTCAALTHYHWYFNNTMKALPEQKMLVTNASTPITCTGSVAMPNCVLDNLTAALHIIGAPGGPHCNKCNMTSAIFR
jgi:hypothetical protein